VKKSLIDWFGVKETAGTYDFRAASTLAIFCNGPWCGQTPNYIRTLLALGYPAAKLKWYRGACRTGARWGSPSSDTAAYFRVSRKMFSCISYAALLEARVLRQYILLAPVRRISAYLP